MIRLFSMFAGYGGAEFALKKAGIPFECVGYSEIDKNAIKCYELNHPNARNFGDCTKINPNDLPDFDLLTGGFPCQDVSMAGKRDLRKGRTNLYSEIIRVAKAKKPKFMLLENVRGLLSMNKRNKADDDPLINKIVRNLKEIGYGVCWNVLNSRDYGIPQNRERVWIVCKYGGWNVGEFRFPAKQKPMITIKDLLERNVDEKYNLTESQGRRLKENVRHSNEMLIKGNISNTLCSRDYKDGEKRVFIQDRKTGNINDTGVCHTLRGGQGSGNKVNVMIPIDVFGNITKNIPEIGEANRIYGTDGISPTIKSSAIKIMPILTPNRLTKRQNGRRFKNDGEPMFTLTGQDIHGVMIQRGRGNNLQHSRKGKETSYHEKDIAGTLHQPSGNTTNYVMNCITEAQGSSAEIRRLTPKECFRLMGFLNDEIKTDGLSDSALYKLAGNGWDINIVSLIFKQMFLK